MELHHLRYFVTVAETLNFHRAAERLHVTQPSVSQHVRELEEELGVRLFTRDLRRVHLTDYGRVLLPRANAVLREIGAIAETMSPTNEALTGTLNLGIDVALAKRVQNIIREYTRQYPRVEIQCHDNFSSALMSSLRTRETDVGFLWTPAKSQYFVSEPVFNEPFSAIVPKASPLANRKQLRLVELSSQILLLCRRTKDFNMRVLELCREAGVRVKVQYTSTLPNENGAVLVESGRGIYVFPQVVLSLTDSQKGIAVVPLHQSLSMTVHMAWRKAENSVIALKFLECARKQAAAFPS